MDGIFVILLVILLYGTVCLLLAAVRALCSKAGKRKQAFRGTFWTFFLEALNPLNWLS